MKKHKTILVCLVINSILLLSTFTTAQSGESHYEKATSSTTHYTYGLSPTKTEIIPFICSTNHSILIITLSSDHDIYIHNFTARYDFNLTGLETCGAEFQGYFCTNGQEIIDSLTLTWDSYLEGTLLRFFQIQSPFFDYQYDNRSSYTIDSDVCYDGFSKKVNITLPAGTWHYIYTAGVFDIHPNNTPLQISVHMNVSSSDENILITASDSNQLFMTSFADLDSKVTISKPPAIELVYKGHMSIHSNHTFLYDCISSTPTCQGVMKFDVQTPTERRTYRALTIRNRWFYKGDSETYGAMYGVGPAGDYTIRFSYLDYLPLLFRKLLPTPWAFGLYFIAMDVELPNY